MTEEMIGKTIADRYRIVGVIGQGGLTTVYKALDTRLNRFVALRLLHPHFARDPEFERRFRHEAEVLTCLNHPNIVQMYDYGKAEGTTYLVVEYVDGRSLSDILAEGKPLDVDYAVEIVRQVGEALSCAHRQGVIHRDIKPSNILIANDGRVLLSDFGLAIAHGQPTLTDIGTVVVTPTYMSPEQARGEPLDRRSDIYSLGTVLYELLAGRLPFTAENLLELVHEVVHEEPPPLRRFNPAVSPALEQAVLRSLAKDPGQRYQSVDEFVAALAEAGGAPSWSRFAMPKPCAPSAALARAPMARHSVSSIAAAIGVGLALLLGLIASLVLMRSGMSYLPTPTNVAIATPSVPSTVAPPTPTVTLWPSVTALHSYFVSLLLGTLLLLVSAVLLALFVQRRRRYAAPLPSPAVCPPLGQRSTRAEPSTREVLPYVESPVASTITLMAQEPSALAWLLVLNGVQRGCQLRLSDSITRVGRDPQLSDIALYDEYASNPHFSICLENGRFYIRDEGSTNGTLVNGVAIRPHTLVELRDRDEIRAGMTIMLFVQAVSPEDLTVEAKRRLREFDSIWDQLTRSVQSD